MTNSSRVVLFSILFVLTACNASLTGKGGPAQDADAPGETGTQDGDTPGVIKPNASDKGPTDGSSLSKFTPVQPTAGRLGSTGNDIVVDLSKLELPQESAFVGVYLSQNRDCSDQPPVITTATPGSLVTVNSGTDGDYFVCYVVRDAENKVIARISEETEVVVDTTPPVLTAVGTSTPSSTTGSATLNLTVSDRSDVTTTWSVTGGTAQQTLSNTSTTSADFSSADDGVYEVVATVTDAKGQAQTMAFQVTVDTTGPVATTATLQVTDVTAGGAKVTWVKASDAVTPISNLDYLVCISTNQIDVLTADNCVATAGAGNFSQDIDQRSPGNLVPNTLYYTNVVVKDASGHYTAYTATSFTTDPDTEAPDAGTFNGATAVNANGFTISWNAASDDFTAASALRYSVCSSTVAANVSSEASCITAQDMTFTAGALSYTLTNKVPSTTYYVAVLVEDAANNRTLYPYTTQATAADTTPPTAGSVSPTTNVTHNSLTLNWQAASDNGTATTNLQYYVCRAANDTTINTAQKCVDDGTMVMNFTANTTTVNVTGLSPNTAYTFRVVVRDAALNQSLYAAISQTTTTYPPNIDTPGATISAVLNASLSPYSFTNNGGTVASCAVDPALPAGLSVGVNAGTCRITGTPSVTSAESEYELTATATDNSTQVVLFDLEVIEINREWTTRTAGAARFAEANSMSNLRVATSDNGDAIVAWSQDNGIYYKRKIGGTWDSTQTRLATLTTSPNLFGVRMNASGHIALLYRENSRHYVAMVKGGSWLMPADIDDYVLYNTLVVGYPHLAFADSGHLIIAYDVSAGHTFVVEKDGNDPWQAPQQIGIGDISFVRDIAMNPSGDAVMGFGIISGANAYACLASRKNGTWTKPASAAACHMYTGNPIFKVGISDNGKLAAVYSVNNSGYFFDHDGTNWQAPVAWTVDSSINATRNETLVFDSLAIDNNGDVSVIWHFGEGSMYEMTAFHSYRQASVWHHPDLAGRIFSSRPAWADNTVYAVMHPTKKGLVFSSSYGGMGFGPLYGAAWGGDWTTNTQTSNLLVDGSDAFVAAVAAARNGYGIIAWLQYRDAGYDYNWVNIAEFE